MKGKYLLPLLVSIILILILVASSCTPTTSTPTTTTTTQKPAAATTTTPTTVTKVEYKDPIYKVLNPVGRDSPTDLKPLAARVDTLAGKKILVLQAEGSPIVMPAVWARVQKEFPTSTFVYTISAMQGPTRPDAEQLKGAQAAIIGNAW